MLTGENTEGQTEQFWKRKRKNKEGVLEQGGYFEGRRGTKNQHSWKGDKISEGATGCQGWSRHFEMCVSLDSQIYDICLRLFIIWLHKGLSSSNIQGVFLTVPQLGSCKLYILQ